MKETDDIRRANENLEALDERARALQDEITAETRRITEQFDAASTGAEKLELAPKRGQVSVQLLGLGWLPDGHERPRRHSGRPVGNSTRPTSNNVSVRNAT